MILNPVLLDVVDMIAVAVASTSVVAPLVSLLKRTVGEAVHSVSLRMPSGREVQLDLDASLSREKVSELVAAAVRSAESNDEAGIDRIVRASRIASSEARVSAE